MSAYDRLAHPPVDGLDRMSCEYLAYEDGRILAAINTRANELFTIYSGHAALAILELRELAQRVQASAAQYRAAQTDTANTPRWPTS